MIFEHIKTDLGYTDMIAHTTESGRVYEHPVERKNYPSITTVLSVLSEDAINKWKKRVGEVEANKISYRASTRGTAVHEMAEKYLDNDPAYMVGYTPNILENFKTIRTVLDERVGKIFSQECALYSDHLRVAGRVDLVAEFDGKISIIDFKTSKKLKPRKFVTNYFAQEAAYAIMWEERTGMPITQLVTIIACDDVHGAPGNQIYIEHRDDHVELLKSAIDIYEKRNANSLDAFN